MPESTLPARPKTRARILDSAQTLILDRGFAGATLDDILRGAGVTKGAFFHHFRSKDELALALIERFAQTDRDLLEEVLARSDRLSRDPLDRVLIAIGLYAEMFDGIDTPPGCLFAAFCYENQLMAPEVSRVTEESMRMWRRVLRERFAGAASVHPPALPVEVDALADMFTALIEGAFVLSKSLREPQVVAAQLRLFRTLVEQLFRPAIRRDALLSESPSPAADGRGVRVGRSAAAVSRRPPAARP